MSALRPPLPHWRRRRIDPLPTYEPPYLPTATSIIRRRLAKPLSRLFLFFFPPLTNRACLVFLVTFPLETPRQKSNSPLLPLLSCAVLSSPPFFPLLLSTSSTLPYTPLPSSPPFFPLLQLFPHLDHSIRVGRRGKASLSFFGEKGSKGEGRK